MTPTVFTDPRLPGMQLRWWPGHGEMQYWLHIGERWQYLRCSIVSMTLSAPEAAKVAKELFSAVVDSVCEGVAQDLPAGRHGLGTYVPERE